MEEENKNIIEETLEFEEIEKLEEKKPSKWQIAKEWLIDLAIAMVIAFLILTVIKPIVIKQSSMENTFVENDYVLISTQSYNLFTDVERGDVIVFESDLKTSNGKEKNLIKRVIGLPGDEIEIIDGYVYINKERISEPYVKTNGTSGDLEKIIVTDGMLFVMGDNREVSLDSRSIGLIDQDAIIGRVVFRIFPISKFGIIKRIEY